MEEHHKRLGQILRFRHENSARPKKPNEDHEPAEVLSDDKLPEASKATNINPTQVTGTQQQQQPPKLAGGSRATARELSRSIANNLASARGIPASQKRAPPVSPTVSAQHVPGKVTRDWPETEQATPSSRKSKVATHTGLERSPNTVQARSVIHDTENEAQDRPDRTETTSDQLSKDAPFQHFYSTIENLMTKLSAPLAFAGLPLTSNAGPVVEGQKGSSQTRGSTIPSLEPDYTQSISRAALRAVQSPGRSGQAGAGGPAAAESFYVVPATGGTISYADIMTRGDRQGGAPNPKHARHISNISTETADDFVDASERPASPSYPSGPGHELADRQALNSRHHSRHATKTIKEDRQLKIHGKTPEELALENMTLRHDFDAVSRRLHMFEASAQQTSAALAQSIRSLARSSPTSTPENSHGKTQTPTPTQTRMSRAKPPDIAAVSRPSRSHNNNNDHDDDDVPVGNAEDATTTQKRLAELQELLRKSDLELERRDRENVKLKETVGRYRQKWEVLKEGAKARRDAGGGGGSSSSSAATAAAEGGRAGEGQGPGRE